MSIYDIVTTIASDGVFVHDVMDFVPIVSGASRFKPDLFVHRWQCLISINDDNE